MLCPLLMASKAKHEFTDSDECKGPECEWWDCVGEQCSIVTIAMELRNIRTCGTKARD